MGAFAYKLITRSLLLVAAGSLVLILIAWGFQVWGFRQPESKRINITRARYEEAFAKWKAHNIEEYEITTDSQFGLGGPGKITLHVSKYGEAVEMLYPEHRQISLETEETIQGLFTQLDNLLDEAEQLDSLPPEKQTNWYKASNVTFDGEFGYPKEMKGDIVGALVHGDQDWKVVVTDFKVIKQGK